ncbi:unnamed protein product [Camellia sinensis]
MDYPSQARDTGQKYIYTGSHDSCIYIYDVGVPISTADVQAVSFCAGLNFVLGSGSLEESQCLNDGTPEVRDAAFSALAAVAKVVGMRPLEKSLEKLDDVRKKKLSEMIGGIDRIARVAFETIRKRGTKLYSVDKANDYRPMIKLPATLVWYTVLLVKWMHAKMASTKLNSSAPLHGVRLALRTSTLNCSAAQKHIGYSPVVSLEQLMAFLSSLNQIASIEWESMSREFMPEFFKLVLGTLSLPINFPGTNYHRGFQARKHC